MRESTDTSSNRDLLDPNHYTFKVLVKPEKIRSGYSTYRRWIFAASLDRKPSTKVTVIMFPWESRGLLLALGGVENKDNPKIIDWDDDEVVGKTFEVDLKHQFYRKSDGTTGTKYILENCVTSLPF